VTTWDPGYGPLIETRMRVVTWNVWGRYGPWEARQPVIEANLGAVDADVICLQEAWQDEERSQPAQLAAALGMEHVYAPAFMMNGGWSGNAVLSRWPIVRHEVVELPMEGGGASDTDAGECRLVLFTEIEGPRGPFQVFCTHLSWRADWSGVRQAQVGAVCEVVRRHSPRQFPAILCGDLNAEPVSDEIRMLTGRAAVPVPGVVFHDAWEAAGEGASATISRRNPYCEAALDPEMRIDYVMVGWAKAGGAGHVLHARVAGDVPDDDGVVGSDHYAVVAELRY